MALSIYGSHRLRHVLKHALCGVGALVVTACSDTEYSKSSDANASQSTAVYSQFIDQAREIALSQSEKNGAAELATNSNTFIQSAAPFELWMFLAFVTGDDGTQYALQQRMVRLRVQAANENHDSEWAFSQVLAVDFSMDHLGSSVNHSHSAVQREALALAGADVAQGRIWVGAYAAQADGVAGCQQTHTVLAPDLNLQFHQSRCLQMDKTKTFNYARSTAMPVDGSYVVDGTQLQVKGHGWLVHGWGVPPDTNASAVLFDRAWLLLDNNIDVQLQRSRRRSGRGPKIVTGALHSLKSVQTRDKLSASKKLIDVALTDIGVDDNNRVPIAWQLQVPGNSIDVSIEPATQSAPQQGLQSQTWFGVVTIHGSHSGFGFINLSAL